jgi:hypothetical protein
VSVALSVRPPIAVPDVDDWAPWPATVTMLAIAHENVAEPEKPAPSVAAIVTVEVPAVVGVPVIDPVEPLIDSPAGSPVALQVNVAPDWLSVAEEVRVVMDVPDVPVRVPGLLTVTLLVTVHVKVAVPDWPDGSVAVSVTEQVQGDDGVPEMVPVDVLMDRPAGRPVADQVKDDTPACESVAVSASGVTAEPVTLVRPPGFVTATVLVTVQEIEVVPEKPAPSVALRVTEQVQGVVGVPVIDPVDELIDRPAGSPVADQVSVWPDWLSVAELVTAVMAVPVTADLLPGLVTVTVLVTFQVNDVVPDWLEGSVAVRVTENVPGVVGVPVIDPEAVLMDRPAGRPVADQVSAWPDWLSVAELATAVMGEPVTLVWLPGFVTATVLVTVQVMAVVPE